MFSPMKMSKVSILVLGRHLNRVTSALGDGGLVHLVDATSDADGKMLDCTDAANELQELESLNGRIEALLDMLDIDRDYEVPDVAEYGKAEIAALLDKVEGLCNEQNAKFAELLQKRTGLQTADANLADYPFQSLRLDSLRNMAHLYVEVGRMSQDAYLRASHALSEDALFVRDDSNPPKVLVISSRKKRFALNDNLDKFGFERIELPSQVAGSVDEARAQLNDEIENLRKELDAVRLHGLELGDVYGGAILAARKQLRTLLFLEQGQKFFGKSRQLYRIIGWLPTQRLEELRKIVEMATDNTGVIQVDSDAVAKGEEVPVQLSNGAIERSFHMLVTNFATPQYHELDPSIFTGITFVLMFGYMFGDVGQGFVLLLLGLFMKLRRSLDEKLRDIGLLLTFCGGSAMMFGFFYGSIFGCEEWLQPLWLNPLKNETIPQLLVTAVAMGVVFISVALLVNVINHFRNRKFFQGVFDKYGVLGICFYWACLGTGIWAVLGNPVMWWQIALILLPLAVLGLKEPLYNLVHYHRVTGEDGSLLDLVLESAVETMETLTGYMSGTVSFIRVGAFAISHAALCMAVFKIVEKLEHLSCGGLLGIIVIIFGNLLVICFEGMVASIQCIRLEYYEMYSRYFQGGGVPYSPYSRQAEK